MTDEQREHLLKMEETQCVHFNGAVNNVCMAGIEYESVRKKNLPIIGQDSCLPCIGCENKFGATCEKYQTPSLQDIVNRRQRSLDLQTAREEIKRHAGGLRGYSSTIQCPVCGSRMDYNVAAYSGLLRGRCQKPGCLMFNDQ